MPTSVSVDKKKLLHSFRVKLDKWTIDTYAMESTKSASLHNVCHSYSSEKTQQKRWTLNTQKIIEKMPNGKHNDEESTKQTRQEQNKAQCGSKNHTIQKKLLRSGLLFLLLFLNTQKNQEIHMWEKEMHDNNLNQTLWTQEMNIVNYEYLSLGFVFVCCNNKLFKLCSCVEFAPIRLVYIELTKKKIYIKNPREQKKSE